MKLSCSLIQDLLPLYVDGVCSTESKEAVREHLSDCPACRRMLDGMESAVPDSFTAERSLVLERHEKKERRKAATVGLTFAAILAFPLLVCLIVNLATSAALDWFFIVLTSLLVTASLTVTPLLVPRCRFAATIGTFTASLLLLLLTCAIYSGGDWFFVAANAVLFGLSVMFAPAMLSAGRLKHLLKGYRGILSLAIDTVLYVLMMIAIGFRVDSPRYTRLAFSISTIMLSAIWLLVLLIFTIKAIVRHGRKKEEIQ